MFNKALVVEDFDSVSTTMINAVKELSIPEILLAKYCDEAYLKIQKALLNEKPFDLLICDLSFKNDFRENKLNSGEELIAAIKIVQPDIKIVVFSIEDKSFKIKSLFSDYGINAYISKGRNSIPELQKAIQGIYNVNTKMLSTELSHVLSKKSLLEIEAYDIELLKLISKGLMMVEIASEFKTKGITPNGSSSLEKRVNKLKTYFKANNNVHLIAIAKDLGLV
ncbi:response regulator [Flavobacterium sp.]|uniref:response regulator n=1 Tax=Flavobacterium sp. TaxID=239 RepID=UPI0038FC45DD